MLSAKKTYLFVFSIVLLSIFLIPSSLKATSFNSIAIDGINDFDPDENFITSSGGYTAYTTWDANNLYLGFSGNDIGTGEATTKWVVWYIDTDPQCGPNSVSGTNYASIFNTQKWTLPFAADYFLQVRTDEGFNQLNKWSGAAWGSSSYNGAINDNDASNYLELSLPLSDIGAPETIRIVGYFLNEAGGIESTYASWPNSSLAGGDGYKNFGAFYNWYEYDLIDGITPNAPANFSPAQNCVIDNNSTTWGFLQESGATGSGQFVPGPGSPPAGVGSANLTVDSSADGWMVGTAAFAGVRLADIDALSYATYRTAGDASLAPALQFSINYDLGIPGATGWQGRLVFEPYRQPAATIPDATWQTWDTINSGNGVWWGSGAPAGCASGSPCTWNDVLATYPNAGINFNDGQFLAKAGSAGSWPGFDGNVDNLAITINGAAYTFDLEPVLPVHNITQGTDHPTIQDGINNAIAGDVIEIDPGIYNEQVVIDRAVTLQGAGIGSTILDGNDKSASGSVGIRLNADVDNVNIYDLSITEYTTGILRAANTPSVTENIVIEDVDSSNNYNGGIHFSGSSSAQNIRFTRVTANNNDGPTFIGRGIFMQSHDKENIIVEDGTFNNNRIAGIDLNIGALDGVRITGNNVSGSNIANQVVDSGIGILGLVNSGTYANEISGNTISVYGRFGIEIKGAQANGSSSGLGSLVVANNNISHADPGSPLGLGATVENRDLAGIAVGNINSSGDPVGVVLLNNTVSGFRQSATNTSSDPDTSTGFCISVSGTNYLVQGNDVSNCDVGIQEQQGFAGDQNSIGDEYFGRDNANVACGLVTGSTFTNNTVDSRQVGTVGSGGVANTNTGESFCSIQAAINDADTLSGHTITVSAGTYTEQVAVNKSLTLAGANTGVPGNGIRGTESVVDGGAGTAVTIDANNVTLDGFNLLGATGVSLGNQSGTVIQNNLIQTNAVGIQVQATANSFTIQNNAITLPQLAGTQPTIGVFLNGLSGTTAPTIQDNVVTGAFYGYLLHAVNTTAPTTINGGAISGVMQGISVVNSVDGTNFYPSSFAADGVTMSGFTGDYSSVPALDPYDFHAGVYVYTGGSSAATGVSGTLANLNIQGTGKTSPDSAGLYFGDFSTITGSTMQNISVDNATISNNLNRGIFARGQNAFVLVQNSTFTDNGLDPHVIGGNYGYSVIARNSATITVEDSIITNSAAQTNSVSYRFHASASGNLVVRGNQISNGTIFQLASGTNLLAYANNITNFTDANLPGVGTVNARHNWWGTYASQPTGVDNDSWAFLLGSAVSTWSDGTGTVTLADGIATDDASFVGSGTLVIVNHGSGLGNVPFGKGIPADTGASQQCADFYDFFAIGGSGSYDVSIPVDGATCAAGTIDDKLFEFALNGSGAPNMTCNPDTACWNSILATRVGDVLTSNVAAADLQGTPFAAPSVNNNDPTAVSLATFSASTNNRGVITAVIIILISLTSLIIWKRRTI